MHDVPYHAISSGNTELSDFSCQRVAITRASMAKRTLNDRALKALKAAPPGKPYDVMDTVVPGFGVRVSASGRRTFVLVTRFPRHPKHPTRRALGEYGELTLEKARTKARDWLDLIHKGVDPKEQEERQHLAEQRKRENSFTAVAEQFIVHIHRLKLRTARVMEQNLNKTFVRRWPSRPIVEISSDDIKRVIREAVERGATYQAFHDFALIRRLFNWPSEQMTMDCKLTLAINSIQET